MSERCEACGHANPNGAKFCNECASPLLAASPDSEGRGYTPRHLADKILTMRAALEGERKQVTVLFVDVQGSMDLQEKVGDEAWHRIMDQFFKLTADSIHGHEGTINQYTGDGVMALFGAPIAHEDHARRACLSALQIREGVTGFADKLVAEHGVGFSVRMGLNSGEVVVGRIGDDLRMDYTAQGQTVGLAARMEGLARAGRILLTLNTRNQVDGLFRLNDRGDTRVKGVSQRVQVFELIEERAAQSRFDVERSRGLGQFVGRDNEFKRLASLLGRAVKGRGQVVGICAEAGLGKSRLCYEFGRHCRDQGMPVYEVRGVSHARAVPLLAFREFFQGFFALDTNATPEQMRETVATKLTALDPELEAFTMLMLDFLNVGSSERSSRQDPEQRQEQLLELMQRMIRAGGLRQPGVIILENLQWLEDDDISRLFLDQLVAEVVSSRVLLIMTFRPEYEVRWSRKRHFSQIELGALDDESMKLLLAGLVGSDDTASELESVLCPRASGNPLFMEEMLRSLESSGALQRRRDALRLTAPVNEIELPAGVQAMISARIDTLPEHSKYLLQTAAVVGKRFPIDVLRDVTHLTEKQLGEALHILDDADFVYQSAAKPEVQYAFRQSLAMEVAYRSQLGERRRDTHHAVAQALIDRYPKRIDQNAVVVAAHFESAGDTLLAADWYSRAAEWSAKADIRESLKRWRRVRDLLEGAELSPEAAALELRAVARFIHLGGRHGLAADELESWVEFGFAALERCADPRLHAYFLMAVGASELFSGQCSAGSERYREADEAAAKSNDPGIRLVTSIGHVFGEMLAGRLDEAIEICEHAIEAGDRVIDEGVDFLGRSPYVNLLGMHAWLLAQRADLGSALRQAKRTLRFARRRREPEHQALAEIVLAMVASESGDPESAIEHGQRASEIATTTGNALVGTYAEMALGRAQLLLQDYSAARDTIEAIRGRMEESGHGRHEEGRILALLSEARAGLGDTSKARAISRDGVKAARRCGNRIAEAEAQLAVAYAGLVGGRQLRRSTLSREALANAAELIETTGARYLKPRLLELQSLAAQAFGDNETAQAAVSEAVDCLRAMGASARVPAMEERLRALQAAE